MRSRTFTNYILEPHGLSVNIYRRDTLDILEALESHCKYIFMVENGFTGSYFELLDEFDKYSILADKKMMIKCAENFARDI